MTITFIPPALRALDDLLLEAVLLFILAWWLVFCAAAGIALGIAWALGEVLALLGLGDAA